jgi:capsular exopolysaccharide synthesis family protein
MDYIQQAIDKARESRHGKIGQQTERNNALSTEAAAGAPVAAPAGVPEHINYTKTRQVELNDNVLRSNRIVAHSNFDKRAEPYRQLRTQVLQKLRANSWKTLAVTSPNSGAGKTVTAVNLAISLSKEVNQTVMLVDLDLRSPSVLKVLGINAEKGLMHHLKGEASVAELLINPSLERLVLLAGEQEPGYSSEILSSPAMRALIDDLTSRYESRILIFDLPALLDNDDALAFIPAVDAALLVVEDGMTTADELERSLQLLEGTNLIGSILNKAE